MDAGTRNKDDAMPVMTTDEVRAFDAWAIRSLGIPGVVLMENAGRSCAEYILRRYDLAHGAPVCVFCGTGNNGGDGFVIGRHLANQGLDLTVVLCGSQDKVQGDARVHLDVIEHMGVRVIPVDPEGDLSAVRTWADPATVVVDALFGTGLKGSLRPEYVRLIEIINLLGRPIVAVDLPSGLDGDTGQPLGVAIRAACTVTFGAVKKGFLCLPAQTYTGEVNVASIGIDPRFWPGAKGR